MTPNTTSRRSLLQQGAGLSAAALSGAGLPNLSAAKHPKATAKRVIFLFMAGAPSQVDLFDPKSFASVPLWRVTGFDHGMLFAVL